eukprot:CAMPEP_0206602576 /NCGR_PEP_ID=MMETSP0325_2-20121206/47502_1 /ASSEMBLY_ACC=CAM_ASM_000347 /TAXON_ID=2866 /ORGANISM="Crypthecodinium cohnii, Strain Seligo" /LENGTH=71 /DNA_ID=CAMNT_0054115155 /DNA_START=51 /DNA_END=266 /DNA_ORIENTATION=-
MEPVVDHPLASFENLAGEGVDKQHREVYAPRVDKQHGEVGSMHSSPEVPSAICLLLLAIGSAKKCLPCLFE